MKSKSKIIRVLLIEDNPGDARLIKEMLTEAKGNSFKLACCDRLATGIKRLNKGEVGLVLLDLSLPDSQGLDTLKKVQAEVKDMPIVVLTGLVDEELAIKAVGQGAQDYLVKGQVTNDLLARSLRYAIERKVWERKEKELAAEREREKERARELRALREELGALKKLSPARLKKEAPIRRKKLTKSIAEDLALNYIQLLRSYTKTKDLDKDEPLVQELCRKGSYTKVPVPDVILLDLRLPRKDGREVLAEIKEDSRLKQIPVVVMTISELVEDIHKAEELNVDAYITKPVDMEKFIKVLESVKSSRFNALRPLFE